MDKSFSQHTPQIRESATENESGEISLEEREVVERIEKLKTGDFTKAMIMIVWKGLKPASEFDFADYDTEHETGRLEQAAEAEKLFADLGLFHHKIQEEINITRFDPEGNQTPGKRYRDRYYIARNKDDLQYIVDYFGKEQNEEIMKKMGTVLGYPVSAIDAWNSENGDAVLPWDYTKEPDIRDEMAFKQFRLSKANWQEEFKVIKKWADEIRRLDPPLYESIVQIYRDFYVNRKSEHGEH